VACLRSTDKNLACGIGQNLDCDGIKAAAGGFGIAITTLVHLYSMSSCQPTSLDALLAPCMCHADSRVSDILPRWHPVKVCLLRYSGPRHLVGLEPYRCQPRGSTGLQRLRGLVLWAESARGKLQSLHLGAVLDEVKLGDGIGPCPKLS
jgi:hypothetical protein